MPRDDTSPLVGHSTRPCPMCEGRGHIVVGSPPPLSLTAERLSQAITAKELTQLELARAVGLEMDVAWLLGLDTPGQQEGATDGR